MAADLFNTPGMDVEVTLTYPDGTKLKISGNSKRMKDALDGLAAENKQLSYLIKWAEDVAKGNMKGAKAQTQVRIDGCVFLATIEPQELSDEVKKIYEGKLNVR